MRLPYSVSVSCVYVALCFLLSLPLLPFSHHCSIWLLPVISLLTKLTLSFRWWLAHDWRGFVGSKKEDERGPPPNGANGFCFLSSLLPLTHHGSVWLLSVISLLLIIIVSPVWACLSTWFERFRETQKKTSLGLNPLCFHLLCGQVDAHGNEG